MNAQGLACGPVGRSHAMCGAGAHCGHVDATGASVCLANCGPAATGAGAVGSACEFTWQCAGGARGVCF